MNAVNGINTPTLKYRCICLLVKKARPDSQKDTIVDVTVILISVMSLGKAPVLPMMVVLCNKLFKVGYPPAKDIHVTSPRSVDNNARISIHVDLVFFIDVSNPKIISACSASSKYSTWSTANAPSSV